jgi:hypothetical protein
MSKKLAQVYIATTKGLVGVSSISELSDGDLRSVATLATSSNLAGINKDYASFVHAPQGIIYKAFKDCAYRIDLSQNIEQGSSWQLGAYIAHYLHANQLLSQANDIAKNHAKAFDYDRENDSKQSNDVIFIATGCINTFNHHVEMVDDLHKKCVRSQNLISQWQAQGKTVCFLVPKDNLRNPISDSPIQLSPIGHLDELPKLFSVFDLRCSRKNDHQSDHKNDHQSDNVDNDVIDSDEEFEKANEIFAAKAAAKKERVIGASYLDTNQQQTFPLDADASKHTHRQFDSGQFNDILETKRNIKRWCVISLLAVSLFVLTLYISESVLLKQAVDSKHESHSKNDASKTAQTYIHVAHRSQNKATCHIPELTLLKAGNILSLGISKTPDTAINKVCALFFITQSSVENVWMVTDSKAIIELDYMFGSHHDDGMIKNSDKDKAQIASIQSLLRSSEQSVQQSREQKQILRDFQQLAAFKIWSIPLPQNISMSRQYNLLVSSRSLDTADYQSLDAYLFSMHEQGLLHDEMALSQWIEKTQNEPDMFIITHTLTQ